MNNIYMTPEMNMLAMSAELVLCQSQSEKSGTVENVDRMDFEW